MAEDYPLNFVRRGQASNRKPPEEELPKIPENLREQATRSTVRLPRSEAARPPGPLRLTDAHHFQVARAASRRPIGQAGTSPQGFKGVSPIQQSIGKAKAIVMSSKLGGHDLGDLQEKMEEIRDDPNVSLQEFEHTLDTVIQNERNKPPEAEKPPGSVTISRGNGPNAISQQELQGGANRNIAQLPKGENFSEDEQGNSYTVGGIKNPANPALPPDAKAKPVKTEAETPYQRAEGAELGKRVNAAEGVEKKAEKVDTSADETKIGAAEQNPEGQEAAFRNNNYFGQKKVGAGEVAKVEAETDADKARANLQEHNLGLPGAPGQETPIPQGTPAPQNAASAQQPGSVDIFNDKGEGARATITPNGPQYSTTAPPPIASQGPPAPQGQPPTHPQTGLPVVQNLDHHAALAPGQQYHAPDGTIRMKALPTVQSSTYDQEPNPVLQ